MRSMSPYSGIPVCLWCGRAADWGSLFSCHALLQCSCTVEKQQQKQNKDSRPAAIPSKRDTVSFCNFFVKSIDTNSQLNSSIIHSLPVMLEMTWLDNVQMVSHKRSTTFSRVAKISLRNPRLRISFQICSIGFISGVHGGIWKRTIFSGNSNPTDLCHAAPSQQSNMMSSEYCSDNCFRKIFMHAVLQYGMTRKYPSPVNGSTAP